MTMELPARISQLVVPRTVLEATRAQFEPFRVHRVEACVLWYGQVLERGVCRVATCIRPEQENHQGHYAISAAGMRTAQKSVRPHGFLLLMQIHSHPARAYFSKWDEEHALNKRPGALNMVIPSFGNGHWIDTERFCVVEMSVACAWRPWTREDWKRLIVVPGKP